MPSGKNSILIAAGLAIVAGLIAYASVRAQQRKVSQGWETVRILCAASDLAEGTVLDPSQIAIRDIPSRFVTASNLVVPPEGEPRQPPVGQRLIIPLKAGDPILLSHFQSTREADFSSLINPRGRAVTIDVQERSAVGLWVRPNDHVDVIGSFRDPESHEQKAVTLLQNVVVLATGKVNANTALVAEDDKRFQTVTLLVLPEEAEILTLAQETGTITLLLRNPDDLDVQEKRSVVDSRQLITGQRATELQQKRYRTIQIIRGKATSRETASASAAAEAP